MKAKTSVPLPQVGRPRKLPNRNYNLFSVGFELLEPEFHLTLHKCGAPKHWHDHVRFLVSSLCQPSVLEAGQFPFLLVDFDVVELSSGEIEVDYKQVDASLFVTLFSENPPVFLKCMTKLYALLEKKTNSLTFQVAAWHAATPEFWLDKEPVIAAELSEQMGKKISAKMVEHARDYIRASDKKASRLNLPKSPLAPVN